MIIHPGTRLQDLMKPYPFLADFLAGLSPDYRLLRQPLLRRTLARAATLERVAVMGDRPVRRLLEEIAAEVRARTGEELTVAERAEPQAAPPADEAARAEVLKEIIRDLHRGVPVGQVKGRFDELVREVAPGQIAELEQRLMQEGIPAEEIRRLCDVHVDVFRESLDEQPAPSVPPGHPVRTYMDENRMAESLVGKIEAIFRAGACGDDVSRLVVLVRDLADIDRHYTRKENQLFPLLEARGVSGPTSVMWAIHDDIRTAIKKTLRDLETESVPAAQDCFDGLCRMVRDMIYKEEHILFPLALETLSVEDWARVRQGEEQIGFAWVKPGTGWVPPVPAPPAAPAVPHGTTVPPATPVAPATTVALGSGALTPEQLDLLLRHLPLDVTFANERDEVAYYSEGRERIFPRSPAVIGRRIQQCHPPKSVHVVERILQAFRSGERDSAEFWIRTEGRFIHIRYFAVRNGPGDYRGTLEVSQDVTGIRALEGERRLLDWS